MEVLKHPELVYLHIDEDSETGIVRGMGGHEFGKIHFHPGAFGSYSVRYEPFDEELNDGYALAPITNQEQAHLTLHRLLRQYNIFLVVPRYHIDTTI